MASTPLIAVAFIATVGATDVVLVIDAAFLLDAVTEVAVDGNFTARVVATTLGAREVPRRFIGATDKPHVLAYAIALAIQAADFADVAFAVATTGIFSVRDAIHPATTPAVGAAPLPAGG